ncbi:GNAT family N-acetyltransferase [Mycoplasmatota bacterium WC44]
MSKEKYLYYELDIEDIIPQQHYLSRDKVDKTTKSFGKYEGYGNIYVIKYRDKFFSIDGHHRLYHLYKKGIKKINVINELEDNSHKLYQILADEALDIGLRTIIDLEDRILDKEDFEVKWIGKCQTILKELKNMDLKLIKLTKDYEEEHSEFVQEFLDKDGTITPAAAYMEGKTFDEFLKISDNYEKDILDNPDYVGAHTYYLLRESDNKLVGAISIRHELNDFLRNYGGHIGYGVRYSERERGYASIMLNLALEKCKEIGIDKVLVTCDKENVGSAKTIVKNGGVLENEVNEGSRITQRYWIEIK